MTRSPWPGLVAVLLAAFMDTTDVSIVNVAQVRITQDLHMGESAGQLLVVGYALPFALTLVTGGRLGDTLGRRRIFLIGTGGFVLASAVAGAAGWPAVLLAARAAQGVCGGLMVPQVLSVITTAFPAGRQRRAAFSLTGVTLGAATVSAPLLGGLLSTSGWRLIFLINIPVGLIALAGARRYLEESRAGDPPRMDLPGAGLLTAASLLLIGPLLLGNGLRWPWWLLVTLVSSVPALLLFVAYERQRERRRDAVLIPTGLFRSRSFSTGTMLSVVLMSSTTCLLLVLTWALQNGLRWTPLHAALTALTWPLGIACTSQLTNRYGHRAARRLVGLGCCLMIPGLLGLVVTLERPGVRLESLDLMPWMVISGAGLGMTLPLLLQVALCEVPAADAGAASGVFNSANQLGAAIGASIAGVIFFAGHPATGPEHLRAAAHTLWYNVVALIFAAALSRLLPAGSSRLAGVTVASAHSRSRVAAGPFPPLNA